MVIKLREFQKGRIYILGKKKKYTLEIVGKSTHPRKREVANFLGMMYDTLIEKCVDLGIPHEGKICRDSEGFTNTALDFGDW